jgi:mono/diheme cytochrome c family protein
MLESKSRRRRWVALAMTCWSSLAMAAEPAGNMAAAGDATADAAQVARGRYMVQTGHCNNCHTAGYTATEGRMPEARWLMGSGPLGWRGPWGTTYASNLRINVNRMSEAGWVAYVQALKARPPMPFWSTAATTPQDLGAMYRFIQQLGPAGEPAGEYLPPDQEPKPPFIQYPMPAK